MYRFITFEVGLLLNHLMLCNSCSTNKC